MVQVNRDSSSSSGGAQQVGAKKPRLNTGGNRAGKAAWPVNALPPGRLPVPAIPDYNADDVPLVKKISPCPLAAAKEGDKGDDAESGNPKVRALKHLEVGAGSWIAAPLEEMCGAGGGRYRWNLESLTELLASLSMAPRKEETEARSLPNTGEWPLLVARRLGEC